jgi:hypothetical protein
LHCLIRRYTTIAVDFQHDVATNRYQLNDVIVLHGDLKYDPNPTKERKVRHEMSGVSAAER